MTLIMDAIPAPVEFEPPVDNDALTHDESWLTKIRAGDDRACDEFVRRHEDRMTAVARRFFTCEHDAADAVQDAFACAFNALDSFEGNSKLSTWLHRIVVNSCLMKLRSRKTRPTVSFDEVLPTIDRVDRDSRFPRPQSDDALDSLSAVETRQQVHACISQLPDPYRKILILRDILEHDTRDTARLLRCSVANVKVRLHRARQALRALLDPILRDRHDPRTPLAMPH